MKSIAYVLLLAGACLLANSCNKNDLPHRKLCQVTSLEINWGGNTRPFHYTYTDKRLLASVSLPFLTMDIEYNNQHQPIAMKDNAHDYMAKLIYKQGRLAEVQEGNISSNTFHTTGTYKYDNKGRIIELVTTNRTWRWEYIGNTHNYKRKMSFVDPMNTGQLKPEVTFEYQYDNKIHPWSTWYNMPANPFYFGPYDGLIQIFEPIPDNNWTYEKVYGYVDGAIDLGQELFYTYTYDGDYPVLQNFRHLGYYGGPGDPPTEELGTVRYTYDCKDNTNGKIY